MKLNSTKFFTVVLAMLCVTVVQGILISKEVYDYLEWYFGFMAAATTGYTWAKHVQNITLARINGNNGG